MTKIIKNNDKLQRRIDSLARLLSLDLNITPCIAVAFVEDGFFITFNSPTKPNQFSVNDAQKFIEEKLSLLRQFLLEFEPYKAEKMAIDYAYLLRKHGGSGVLSSKNYSGFKKKYTINERIRTDLIKLAEFYRNSPSSNPGEGFSQKHTDTLIKAKPFIIYPCAEKESAMRGALHAEQLIMFETEQYYQARGIRHFKVTIGISKLACQVCESVLNQEPDKFNYRGASGTKFPNVIDMKTGQRSLVKVFSSTTREDLTPYESDSEPESIALPHFNSKRSPSLLFKSSRNEVLPQKNRDTSIPAIFVKS